MTRTLFFSEILRRVVLLRMTGGGVSFVASRPHHGKTALRQNSAFRRGGASVRSLPRPRCGPPAIFSIYGKRDGPFRNKKAPGVNLPRPLHTDLFLAMGAEHAASAAEHDARERRAAVGAGLAAPAVHLQKGGVAVVLSPARRVICKRDAVLFDEIL